MSTMSSSQHAHAPGSVVEPAYRLAEADGNRPRLTEVLDHVGVEDRGAHQAPRRLHREILGAGRTTAPFGPIRCAITGMLSMNHLLGVALRSRGDITPQ